jgi:hypothetical protein
MPPLYAFIAPTTQPLTLPAAKYNMKSRYRYLLCPWIILEQEYSKN